MNASFEMSTGAMELPQPYLLFLGDNKEASYAKTAFGLRDWAGDKCVGEFSFGGAISTGLPQMNPAEAYAKGARALVIGVANSGGVIGQNWIKPLTEAIEAGLDVVSGMHIKLVDIPELVAAAKAHGRKLIDIRTPPANIPIGTGRKRSGKRLLTVGTDCALGKKYTAMALFKAFGQRGLDVNFRATGQTGIMIAGGGMPMDAIISDFEAGAAEILSPDAAPDHWDIIEGQGSLFHPAYAAVTLGLLHGSQPDVLVVCHEPGRAEMVGAPGYKLPTVDEVIDLALTLGSRTNPAIRCRGIAYNSSKLEEQEAIRLMASESDRLGIPVSDPVRGGEAFDLMVDSCLS